MLAPRRVLLTNIFSHTPSPSTTTAAPTLLLNNLLRLAPLLPRLTLLPSGLPVLGGSPEVIPTLTTRLANHFLGPGWFRVFRSANERPHLKGLAPPPPPPPLPQPLSPYPTTLSLSLSLSISFFLSL